MWSGGCPSRPPLVTTTATGPLAPQATWPSPSRRRTTAALVCSPVISLKYVRRCTSGLWPITAATSA